MELDSKDKIYIYNSFYKMNNKLDLLQLINFCKKKIYGEEAHPISLKQFNYHINPLYNNFRYNSFIVKKKSGGDRIIFSPNNGLKVIQKCLNLILQVVYKNPSKYATGFISGRSIVDNAKIHVNRNYVFNIDLKDFFYSIDQARVWGRLQVQPFNFSKKENKLELANIVASLCCHSIEVERFVEGTWIKNQKNVLPQGAPTSPVISNIICERLDYYLSAVAKRFGLKYTRYVDDITFSSDQNVYQVDGDFRKELEKIVQQEGFYFNVNKTRLQKRGFRQEVTGVIVNEKVNTNKHFVKRLKKWIYLWENYGYERASIFFKSEYEADKLNFKTTPSLVSVLRGKLNYLKMLKGDKDSLYLNLNSKFDKLLNGSIDQKSSLIKITKPAIPVIHQPQKLVAILKKFTTNNTALKYSTHTWDGGKDTEIFANIEDFLIMAEREYKTISYDLSILSKPLNAKIWTFLFSDNFSKNGWGMFNVRFGWNSMELHKYLNGNPNNKPESYILPEEFQQNIKKYGKSFLIQSFKNVIDLFKNEIEIRDENSTLEDIVISLHKTYLNGFNILKIENLANKNFYTDVDYLYKALELVFHNIQKRPQYPNVGYIGYDFEDYFCLEIMHFESNAKGKSFKDSKFTLKEGDFGTISNYLKNLCDWSIESSFSEGTYQVNFLSSKNISPYKLKSSSEGFKYIFKFYK
ncbi:reverse transcriptase domain-containing protein [Chryseobacterium gregarium]|uniref:reverse transcriptase domain-containing protein n=1 Tax=Chryseobacterium gregarium TaxID=456299 RepID=UPI000400A343|nr:reverse transcriptase domain-containing protein [Chryseobacterium gregarium]